MTVRELIQQLQGLDGESTVVVDAADHDLEITRPDGGVIAVPVGRKAEE